MEATLLPLFGGHKISNFNESEILVLHRNMRLEVIKVIKPFLQIFKLLMEGKLIIDGHHVGFVLQVFMCCGKFVGMWECH
jgi:hypothetical protein